MIQRQDLPTQAEIDRALARGRQLRAQAVAAAFARLGAFLAARIVAGLRQDPAYRGRPARLSRQALQARRPQERCGTSRKSETWVCTQRHGSPGFSRVKTAVVRPGRS